MMLATRICRAALPTQHRRIVAMAACRVHWDSTTCPYAQRSWVALVEKGLQFEVRKVDLANKDDEFKAVYASINPDPAAPAKVPILVEADGTKLIESAVIVDYLEQRYPEPALLPADAGAAARARLFAETFNSQFIPAFFSIYKTQTQEAVEVATGRLAAALKVLDAFLRLHGSEEGGAYFLGGTYSYAEVMCTGFLQRAIATLPAFRSVDLWALVRGSQLDRLERWMNAALARPSAQQTKPADDVIVAGMAKFVAPFDGKQQ